MVTHPVGCIFVMQYLQAYRLGYYFKKKYDLLYEKIMIHET